MKYADEELTGNIIECIIAVHQTLGPGFLEEVGRHRLDILAEDRVVVELKTVESLSKAHYAQVRSYLKATDLELGLLVNFAGEKADFRRVEP